MQRDSTTWGRFRTQILSALDAGPPPYPGERWFGRDLHHLTREELTAEAHCLELGLALMPSREHGEWPGTWTVRRLAAIKEYLRRA